MPTSFVKWGLTENNETMGVQRPSRCGRGIFCRTRTVYIAQNSKGRLWRSIWLGQVVRGDHIRDRRRLRVWIQVILLMGTLTL